MNEVSQTITARRIVLWLLVAATCWPAAAGRAQTEFSGLPELGTPVFWADVAMFRGLMPDEVAIEVYYRILNPNLTYVLRDEKYYANYEIDAILRRRGNPQVASASVSESYAVPSYAETRSEDSYLINKLELTAPPGEYKLELKLRDRISNHSFERTLDVRIPEFSVGGYSVSSPLFCQGIFDTPVPEKFMKYGRAVLPKVSRVYGGKQEELPIYLEIYTPGDTAVELFLTAHTFHHFQDRKRVDTIRFKPKASGITPVLLTIPLGEFVPGECELTLKLTDGQRELVKEIKTGFEVEWSLLSMIRHDWELVIDQLVHITSHKELKALREAAEDQRVEMLQAFWKSKDPTPETPENEWQNEYYRRIRFADAHYTNPYRRGWQTDFGMVYIRYGEPDQIERYPFEMGEKPYEIWYYYAQGRKFVFVDAKGNDDYQLQYPYDGLRR